jgi:hypothetical protein
MNQNKFLAVSSAMLKIYAWIVLISALLIAVALGFGAIPSVPRWMGFIVLVAYALIFLFLYTIALIADILRQLTEAINSKR